MPLLRGELTLWTDDGLAHKISYRMRSVVGRSQLGIRSSGSGLAHGPEVAVTRGMVADASKTKLATRPELRDFSEMPGPPTLPLLGNLWDYIKPGGLKFSKMFENYKARSELYGPVYKEQLGRLVSVIVSDPVEYDKVIHNEHKQPRRVELEPMAHYRRKKKLGLGLVNSQSDEWAVQRHVLSKKMLRPAEVVHYCQPMSDVADDFVNHLAGCLDRNGQIQDLKTEVFKWALESVGVFLFDTRIGCFRPEGAPKRALDFIVNLQGFFAELQKMLYTIPLYKLFRTPSYRRFEKNYDRIIEIGQYYVNERASQLSRTPEEEREGFIWYLLSQKQLGTRQANLAAIEMMTGGVETVSNTLLWALLLVARNPRVQAALTAEIDSLGEPRQLTKQDLAGIPYIKAFFKESFRCYPITFATSRILQNEMELGGYRVPEGVQVQASLHGMGHDPRLFPQPELVRPERWLKQEEGTQYQAFSNLVWGHGPRMCIGRRLAEQELRIILIKILQKYHLSWRECDAPPEPILHTVMTPDRPLKVCFTER